MADETTYVQPGMAEATRPDISQKKTNYRLVLWIAVALAVATFAVYLGTLHNGFISYDDPDYITNNPLVRQGLTWHGVANAFRSFDQANWFPLEWISLMGTSQIFGMNPAAYHFTNLVLHICNVILLFLLLQKATGKAVRSATVAALFAVFPLNVEAVAWATERKSVLSVFFLLLALGTYGWYVRRPGLGRYLAIVVLFGCGLMTKAWLVTFPFALLLLDYWPLQRFGGATGEANGYGKSSRGFDRLVLEKVPLIVMSLATTIVGIYAARAGDALSISTARVPFSLRFENALWSYLVYILKGIWPAGLAIIYPFPQHSYPAWKIACAGAFLLGVTALVWRARSKRYLLVGWLWYLGVLFPVIGLIQTGTQSFADRWAYISFWGLFVAVVWAMADLVAKLRLSRAMLAATTGAVLLAYGAVAYAQTAYWHDDIALYSHALAVTKQNGPVRVNLGNEYARIGRPDLALEEYRLAVADMPTLGVAHYDLAGALADQHDLIDAQSEYRLAISNTAVPHEVANAHVGLGAIYMEMNLPAKATEEFTAALNADANDVYALLDRGMIEFRQNKLDDAGKDFLRSTQIAPTPMSWYTLGVVLEAQRNPAAAIHAYESALRLDPNLRDAADRLEALQGKQP
ncbi:MAG TPA: tetratricopeptide repeat protein [Candidatus Acidoferrales bacterium]